VARLSRRVGPFLVVAVASLALSACGTGGAVTDARAACKEVHAALRLQAQSEVPTITNARQSQLQSNALSELLRATPAAAAATSADGSWNPLMTTINEAERVPLQNLVASLTRLCRVADSSTPYL